MALIYLIGIMIIGMIVVSAVYLNSIIKEKREIKKLFEG
jgi:L-lactate permease